MPLKEGLVHNRAGKPVIRWRRRTGKVENAVKPVIEEYVVETAGILAARWFVETIGLIAERRWPGIKEGRGMDSN